VLQVFKWAEFGEWKFDTDQKKFSFIVKTSPPHPMFSFETPQGDAIIALCNDYDLILRYIDNP